MIEVSRKFEPLYKNQTRYYIVTGGRGSAKSFNLTLFLLWLSFEHAHRILFTRYTLTSAHISIIPEFQEKLQLMQVQGQFDVQSKEIRNIVTGNEIIFRGIKTSSGNQTANLKSLQGITTWVLDEAEELQSEKIFNDIDFSIRAKGAQNRVILILNPTTKEHWIYKRFFEGKWNPGTNGQSNDVTYIHTSYFDNIANLSKSFIDQVNYLKETNLSKYNHVLMGGWLDKAEGVIFTNWKQGEWDDSLPCYYGLDFGFSIDPTALVRVAIKNKTAYLKVMIYERGLTSTDIIQRVRQSVKGNDMIIADSAEPRLIEELKRAGLNVIPAHKGADSVRSGVKLMQSFELVVCDSPELESELNNYAWSDKKSDTPIDAYNHCFIGSTQILTPNKMRLMVDIQAGDYVVTPEGNRIVIKKFNNGIKQVNKYLMQFDTFCLTLCCTSNHKIKTNQGWQSIESVKPNQTIYLHSYITELSSDCTQEKDIFQEDAGECMLLFGKHITIEKYQKGFMFIILMKTLSIMTQQILLLKKKIFIYQSMVKRDVLKIKNGFLNFKEKELKSPKIGMQVKKELNGIESMQKGVALVKTNKCKEIVISAEKNTLQKTKYQNSAIKTVKLNHLEVVESWKEEVYDIMVDKDHCYFANGVLVHNCIDGIRYVISMYNELNNSANANSYGKGQPRKKIKDFYKDFL